MGSDTSTATLFSMRPTLVEMRDGNTLLGRLYSRVVSDDETTPQQYFRAAADAIVPRDYNPSTLQIYFDGHLVYDCDLITGTSLLNRVDPNLLTKIVAGEVKL